MSRSVVAIALTACAAEEPPPGYAVGLGTPANPVPSAETYLVRSRVAEPLGVAAVTDAIGALTAFGQGGGATLLARATGTPALAALSTLPSTLQQKLPGWIDIELDKQKLGTKTARQAIADIAVMAETVTDHFAVESELTITPTGATHALRDLNFSPASLDVVVPIGGYAADMLDQKTTAAVSEGGALALGKHQFALAFGSHAWQGLNLGIGAVYGGDMSIIAHLDCNAVGQSVAARCVSTTCVGHASDITSLCQRGLAALVDDLRGALAPVELDTLRFVRGSARLVDDNRDGVADRIVDGTWDAETDVGTGVHATQVMFDAAD